MNEEESYFFRCTCGTGLIYNAEMTHDPKFKKEGVRWYYCSKCKINISSKEGV